MAKQVIWSPMAIDDLAGILQYLQKDWSQKVASDFINQIGKIIESVSLYPIQFPPIYRNKNIRKIVITKQNTLYCRIKRNQIIILRIFDSRQDPNKLILP